MAPKQTEAYLITDDPFSDYKSNAKLIGISFDEYTGFVRQFVEESLSYESVLKNKGLDVFKRNLISIKDASQLLHLQTLSNTLQRLEKESTSEHDSLLNTFFGMIRHIQRDLKTTEPHQPIAQPVKPAKQAKPAKPANDLPHTPSSAPVEPTPQAVPPLPSTEEIAAIPFAFSTKAASDELGLPETLVQEFVSDFIKQAEENLEVFHVAQRSGDMETIQKTAHLLKGAASNLRIDPLAETLKKLQYNEKPDKVAGLFREFVGQLKALINFTRQSSI
jgi:HPt (histidine-containing phosphotransfer) domain-containing protein